MTKREWKQRRWEKRAEKKANRLERKAMTRMASAFRLMPPDYHRACWAALGR